MYSSGRYLVSASLLLLLSLGCSGGGGAASTGTTTPPTSSATKAPIVGLVAMGQENFNSNPALTPDNSLAEPNANPNIYTASVILVTWKQLQPTGSTGFDPSAIDAGLAVISAYNTAHPTHRMTGKLRVFAGINAPAWAQSLDGAPVILPGVSYTAPRFWTTNYIAAWKNLQNLLAARYDSNLLLAEVAVSGCSSSTAEPFIHPTGSANIPILKAAGFTDAQFQTCLSTMADQYSAWTRTPLDYTFNQFIHVDSGNDVADSAYTIQIMAAWRAALGTSRGVIANHGLQPTLTSAALAIYPEFTFLGPPIEFQSYGPLVDWPSTVALAVTYKATELEIWTTTQAGGQAVISYAQLQTFATQI